MKASRGSIIFSKGGKMKAEYIRYNFTRQTLFELVWLKQPKKIQAELHITYNQLRKLCMDYDIPRPNAGFWAKSEADKIVLLPRLSSNNFPKDKAISIRVPNPEFEPPTEEYYNQRLFDYVRGKILLQRERQRKDFVFDILKRTNKLNQIVSLCSSLKKATKSSNHHNVEKMILWMEDWVTGQQQKNSLDAINLKLEETDLFDEKEPEIDTSKDIWDSGYLDPDEFEHFMNNESLFEGEEEEEIIEWNNSST